MSSKRGELFGLIALVAGTTLGVSPDAMAEADFRVSPQTCVSLYRDQPCSQLTQIRWTPLPRGHYCLRLDIQSEPLVCWRGAARTSYRHTLRSIENRRYELVRSTDGFVIGASIVERAWVYRGKANSSGGWRVF